MWKERINAKSFVWILVKLNFSLAGLKAGWHLDHVKVIDESSGKDYMFPCGRWLARDEEDGQIMRELLCSNALTPRDDKEKVSKYAPMENNRIVHINNLAQSNGNAPVAERAIHQLDM